MPGPLDSPLEAGKLDRRVTLEALVPSEQASSDANAEPAEDWAPVADLWASVKALQGRELLTAKQVVATATHAVTVRWRDGLSSRSRFTYRGERYNVVAPPQEIGRRWGLYLLCEREEGV